GESIESPEAFFHQTVVVVPHEALFEPALLEQGWLAFGIERARNDDVAFRVVPHAKRCIARRVVHGPVVDVERRLRYDVSTAITLEEHPKLSVGARTGLTTAASIAKHLLESGVWVVLELDRVGAGPLGRPGVP